MKKFVCSIVFFILLTAFNCENEPLEGDFVIDDALSCTEANNEVQVAKANFNTATEVNFSELCNAYKLALQNKAIACGDDGSVQDIIDSLGNCSFTN